MASSGRLLGATLLFISSWLCFPCPGVHATVLGTPTRTTTRVGQHPFVSRSAHHPHRSLQAAGLQASEAAPDAALAQHGKQLYAAHCEVCHGQAGHGGIGPNIQGKTVDDIDKAIATVQMMSSLQSLPQPDRSAIAAYLKGA